ncbi:putative inactive receptor kinase [Acorus calamus]|uniref:Inactive receptor kinase n=1 Tax=Acorus calamus TaxID=4465 RepID=A0AAV9DII9_ACOCL|nr:putative inactive receptor kinase [Acorus calamus]
MLPLLLFSSFFLLSSAVTSPPLPPDALALLAFKTTTDASDRLHFPTQNQTQPNPHCEWVGVKCSIDGRVVRLVLEGLSLRGLFSHDTLTRLSQLRLLSLSNNSLHGPLPDLSPLSGLRSLYLANNAFSGGFPASLLSLRRIRTVDLSHNSLTGPIPISAAAQLDRVYCLSLEFNAFVGSVPPFNQSSLKVFNVSHNNLTGPVPVTATLSVLGESAFFGNPGLCGEVVRRECPSHLSFFTGGGNRSSASTSSAAPATMPNGQLQEGLLLPSTTASASSTAAAPSILRRQGRGAAIGGFSVGLLLLIGSLIAISIALKKRHKTQLLLYNDEKTEQPEPSVTEGSSTVVAVEATAAVEKAREMGKSGCLVFCAGEAGDYTMEQLMRASAEMLGRGTVGTTYKATMMDGLRVVTVKRLDAWKGDGAGTSADLSKEGFERGMDEVGGLRHPNLVPLRAYFHAKQERLLIYDYQPNGSLFLLMHGMISLYRISLLYLFQINASQASSLDILPEDSRGHCAGARIHPPDVQARPREPKVIQRPPRRDFEACLSDYCLSFLRSDESFNNDDTTEDSSGYRAPEMRKSNHGHTVKSDVFAFGVLLLELLTGKPPSQHPLYIADNLPQWVRSVREDEGSEDERLIMLVDIAATCVRVSPDSRPTAWQVLKMIQEVKEIDTGENEAESDGLS